MCLYMCAYMCQALQREDYVQAGGRYYRPVHRPAIFRPATAGSAGRNSEKLTKVCNRHTCQSDNDNSNNNKNNNHNKNRNSEKY